MFVSILEMVKTHVSVNNLKQYLCQTFPEFEESFQDGDTVDDVMTAVRNECSLADCSYFEGIAQKFNLKKCQQTINNYHSILRTFCHHTLNEHSYFKSVLEDFSRNIVSSDKIVFKLMWNASPSTIKDIRDVLQMRLVNLAVRVQIIVLKEVSVIVVCSFFSTTQTNTFLSEVHISL